MRTGCVLLGFVLLGGGCGDDGVGATETTLTTSTTTPTPMTTSGTTADAPTTSGGTSTSTGSTSTGGAETTVDPSTSSGTTMGVDPSTSTTTTTGEPETTTSSSETGGSTSTGEESSSGGESSTGEIVVCPPPKPDSQQCEACLEMNCCQEYDACFADVKCTCIFNCIFSGQGPMGCAFTCMNMGMQNPTLGAMFICGDDCGGCPW
jgi:hypothetical protein